MHQLSTSFPPPIQDSWVACALPWASLVVEKCLIAARCIPCPRVTSVEAEAWRLSVVINTTQQSVHVQRERRRSMNICTCRYSDDWEGGRFQGVVSSWIVFSMLWFFSCFDCTNLYQSVANLCSSAIVLVGHCLSQFVDMDCPKRSTQF